MKWLKIASVVAVALDFLTPGMGGIGGYFDYAVSAAKAAGLPANSVMFTPSNPTAAGSTTPTMAGIGVTGGFTPRYDGVAMITVAGILNNSTALSGVQASIAYGIGTAPTNGAAATGQICGNVVKGTSATAAAFVPFSITCVATGLALTVPYWIDLQQAQIVGATATITNITVTAVEQ